MQHKVNVNLAEIPLTLLKVRQWNLNQEIYVYYTTILLHEAEKCT